jgi:hypothetical protein
MPFLAFPCDSPEVKTKIHGWSVMKIRAGLVSVIALSQVLFLRPLILNAQAAPVPVQASTIQILPVTAPVPNIYFRQEDFVHLQIHPYLGSTPARSSIHMHDVHDSSVPNLARRKPVRSLSQAHSHFPTFDPFPVDIPGRTSTSPASASQRATAAGSSQRTTAASAPQRTASASTP